MAAAPGEHRRAAVRLRVDGSGKATVSTGLPVLDHLVALLAERARFDLVVDVAADAGVQGALEAARAFGAELADTLEPHALASALVPTDEALAQVAAEVSGRPLVVSNVDLSDAHVAGLATDVVSKFVRALADGAGLTLHVRLVEGRETQHVLDSIFKALGVVLGDLARGRRP
jgi:imidazoleglycerol-phosphate dehydratase